MSSHRARVHLRVVLESSQDYEIHICISSRYAVWLKTKCLARRLLTLTLVAGTIIYVYEPTSLQVQVTRDGTPSHAIETEDSILLN